MTKLSKHNQNLLDEAVPLLELLKGYIFDAVIAGGFPRDVAHGRDAKDVDICVYNWHSNDYAEITLRNKFLEEISKMGFEWKLLHGIASDGETATFKDHQVDSIITLEDCPVDIIFYEDCVPNPSGPYRNFSEGKPINTVSQLVSQFDCNLNQYIFDLSSGPLFVGTKNPMVHGVYMVRGANERQTRVDKMFNYAMTEGYSFSENL